MLSADPAVAQKLFRVGREKVMRGELPWSSSRVRWPRLDGTPAPIIQEASA